MKTKSLACQLVVRDLVVKVKEKTILNGVNSMAGSGDLLAIMGPTGKNNI
jgi:Fe-S cluster assembly ATPase SufC